MWNSVKLCIVGNRGGTNVGGSFERAAHELGISCRLVESNDAMIAPMIVRRINWWLRGRRPTWLGRFSQRVVEVCAEGKPDVLIATGIAPLTASALSCIRDAGARCCNYLTDDPWNPAHRASWFMRSLPSYDRVFSTRLANMEDLRLAGVQSAHYLPFAYDPKLHYRGPYSEVDQQRYEADVVFVGGAEPERVKFMAEFAQAGINVVLYGDFWERYSKTRRFSRGHIGHDELRLATGLAKVCVCMVRRANRDGHVMRSFEIPAIGSCMLAEDTVEHRRIFGEEGVAVMYFSSPAEMVSKTRWLLENQSERIRMAEASFHLITGGKNTYCDRLKAIMQTALSPTNQTLSGG